MFKTLDGREHFYQWDSNIKLIVEDAAITEVHFCNRTDECSLICETYKENGLTLVNVPNILLQSDWKIHCYAFGDDKTKYEKCFEVKARTKPADYVYTETEIKRYEDLEERIEELDENKQQRTDLLYTVNTRTGDDYIPIYYKNINLNRKINTKSFVEYQVMPNLTVVPIENGGTGGDSAYQASKRLGRGTGVYKGAANTDIDVTISNFSAVYGCELSVQVFNGNTKANAKLSLNGGEKAYPIYTCYGEPLKGTEIGKNHLCIFQLTEAYNDLPIRWTLVNPKQ